MFNVYQPLPRTRYDVTLVCLPEWCFAAAPYPRSRDDVLLSMLLQEKFGQLPAWALDKLESADPSNLETWAKAVLRKNTLEKVFAPN